MRCKTHDRPMTMTCDRCSDSMCPACAEYIAGSWFCPRCAAKERSMAAGFDYYDRLAAGLGEPDTQGDFTKGDIIDY